MPVTLFSTGTEFLMNEVTMLRGTDADIVSVGVFHSTSPNAVPSVSQFTTVTLVRPGDALAEGAKTDIASRIGNRAGAISLVAGDYQRFVLLVTASEDIIRYVDVITVK